MKDLKNDRTLSEVIGNLEEAIGQLQKSREETMCEYVDEDLKNDRNLSEVVRHIEEAMGNLKALRQKPMCECDDVEQDLKRVIETQEAKIKSMELDVDKVRCFESAGIQDSWEFYWEALQDFKWIGLDDDDDHVEDEVL